MARFMLRFYAPILLGIFLLALVLLTPKIVPTGPRVDLEFGVNVGLLGIKIPLNAWIDNVWIFRLSTALVALVCLIYGLAIDFSRHFPTRLAMDAYFDTKGIKRTLRLFSARDLGEVAPPEDWEARIGSYDNEVVEGLNALWLKRGIDNAPSLENMGRDLLHAHGETLLRVKRMGWLLYRITESSGFLRLVLEVRNRSTFRFRSEFYLRDAGVNHIRPRLLEILRSPVVILRPEFKQVFQVEQGGTDAPFDHVVIAVTKVRLLPTPSFSDTLYLWRDRDGMTVPVAYAIYSSTGAQPEVRGTSF